jgi:hypothetical protein
MTNPSLHTQGTKFKRGTGSPLVYTTVAGILDTPRPAKSARRWT